MIVRKINSGNIFEPLDLLSNAKLLRCPIEAGILPYILFPPKYKLRREFERFPMDSGMGPSRRLPSMARKFPSPGGTYPLRRLCAIRMLCMFVTLCKDLGIEPVNLLKQKLKFKRLGSLSPTSSGISPRSWFEATARKAKEEMLYRDRGTLPVRLLILRSRCFRFLRRSKSAGISPPILLVAKSRVRREEMFAKDGGIVPERLFPPRLRISRLFRLLSSSGIVPEISFCIKSRIWRFKHLGYWTSDAVKAHIKDAQTGKSTNLIRNNPCKLLTRVQLQGLELLLHEERVFEGSLVT
ncbi:hypothetical protein SADUNF_Sadunf05G0022500 [Salix dunnii]|uniref:Uncharacterized protein n=1 Tax=Salix dunnii TaxID=1413687 RepID=A0A835N1L1_9ROSI|nr:hypothetical protein SADUNF_Sadunf05G0022500 [Salix dunnii]